MHFVKWPPEGHCVQEWHLGPAGARGALLGIGVARVPGAQRRMKCSETCDLWAPGAGWGRGSWVLEGGGAKRSNVWVLNTEIKAEPWEFKEKRLTRGVYLFIWLPWVLTAAHGIFDLCHGMWDL